MMVNHSAIRISGEISRMHFVSYHSAPLCA